MNISKKLIIMQVLIGFFVFFGVIMAEEAKASTCVIFNETATDNVGFGRVDNTIEQMAQPFSVTSDCTGVTEISVTMQANGSPTDDVTIGLWSDSAGSPGSLIEQCSNIDVTGSSAEYISTCAGTTDLQTGNTYWVYADRTGANNNSNYYRWDNSNTNVIFDDPKYFSTVWNLAASGYNQLFSVIGVDVPVDGSTTTQVLVISNPAQDLWNGLILLLLVMFFTVWFFKRH